MPPLHCVLQQSYIPHLQIKMASASKHVLNDPATLVVDSLKGLATLNPQIKLDEAARGGSIHHFAGCMDA